MMMLNGLLVTVQQKFPEAKVRKADTLHYLVKLSVFELGFQASNKIKSENKASNKIKSDHNFLMIVKRLR